MKVEVHVRDTDRAHLDQAVAQLGVTPEALAGAALHGWLASRLALGDLSLPRGAVAERLAPSGMVEPVLRTGPRIAGLAEARRHLEAVHEKATSLYVGRSREPDNRLLHLVAEQKLPSRQPEQSAFLTVLAVTHDIDHAKDLEEELLVHARHWPKSCNGSLGVGGKQDGATFTIYVHWLAADDNWDASEECFEVMSEEDLSGNQEHPVGTHLVTELSADEARDVLNSVRSGRRGDGQGRRGRSRRR